MIFIACINRYYSYKSIYSNIYLVRIDQTERVIRIRNIYFDEGDLYIEDLLKNKIYKIIFDNIEKDEKKDKFI